MLHFAAEKPAQAVTMVTTESSSASITGTHGPRWLSWPGAARVLLVAAQLVRRLARRTSPQAPRLPAGPARDTGPRTMARIWHRAGRRHHPYRTTPAARPAPMLWGHEHCVVEPDPDVVGAADRPRVHHLGWLLVLVGGAVVWIVGAVITAVTEDTILVPTLILVGSFLVPVTMVTFALTREGEDQLSEDMLILAFVLGGAVGVVVAAFVETYLLPTATGTFIMVGLIEELTKALIVVVVASRLITRRPCDGMVFGATVGAGFAAFESAGYAFAHADRAPGGPSDPQHPADRGFRGLLSPVRPHHLDGDLRRCVVRGRRRERPAARHLAAGRHDRRASSRCTRCGTSPTAGRSCSPRGCAATAGRWPGPTPRTGSGRPPTTSCWSSR